MEERTLSYSSLKSLTFGMHNAVKNGELLRDIPTQLTFVADETERNALENVLPGTFAASYGLTHVWQYDGETWKTIK